MTSPKLRFSIVTDDYSKSVSLYRDAIGLQMAPPCNPLAIFRLGEIGDILLEVCQRECGAELVAHDFVDERVSGLVVTKVFGDIGTLNATVEAAIAAGARTVEHTDGGAQLVDFNGVAWSFVCYS